MPEKGESVVGKVLVVECGVTGRAGVCFRESRARSGAGATIAEEEREAQGRRRLEEEEGDKRVVEGER